MSVTSVDRLESFVYWFSSTVILAAGITDAIQLSVRFMALFGPELNDPDSEIYRRLDLETSTEVR